LAVISGGWQQWKKTMTTELIFETDADFDNLTYDKNAGSWTFLFTDNIYASSTGFWRLLKSKVIQEVSLDHGHQFGLTKPLDLTKRIREELTGKKLTRIKVDKDTGDLTLTLTEGYEIEIFTASTGYETYDFTVDNKQYIGLGRGEDIAIMEQE
jgi:hypothetical protein